MNLEFDLCVVQVETRCCRLFQAFFSPHVLILSLSLSLSFPVISPTCVTNPDLQNAHCVQARVSTLLSLSQRGYRGRHTSVMKSLPTPTKRVENSSLTYCNSQPLVAQQPLWLKHKTLMLPISAWQTLLFTPYDAWNLKTVWTDPNYSSKCFCFSYYLLQVKTCTL